MDIFTTKPIEEIEKLRFKNLLSKKEIKVSLHAYDHLSEKQRKIFKVEELIQMLQRETPRKIYLQKNGRYATYFRKPDGFRKLILEIDQDEVIIVTFIDTTEIPKIKL